jgi:hypothetical protein
VETTELGSLSPVKKTIGRAVTVLLWVIIAGGAFFVLNWVFWLWPVTLMLLVFVPVMFAFGLAFAASAYFGDFLGRKLAGWSGWDRKMSEFLCFVVIVIAAVSPVLYFVSSGVFHDWCVAAWNFGLTFPHRQVLL